jgi:hypothetical protein
MLIERENTCLIMFNMLSEFLPSLVNSQKLVDDSIWLMDFVRTIGIPVISIEHKGLGGRLDTFNAFSDNIDFVEVTHFSCMQEKAVMDKLESKGKKQVLLAGAEAHISILQTVLEFKQTSYQCYVIADAMSSRNSVDYKRACNRLEKENIELITKEMFFFECLRQSEYPNYIDMSLKFLDGRYIRG